MPRKKRRKAVRHPKIAVPPCACDKDDDGKCVPCINMMKDVATRTCAIFEEFNRSIFEAMKSIDGMCKSCGIKNADLMLVTIIKDLTAFYPLNVTISVAQGMKAGFKTRINRPLPLMDKMIRDLRMKKNG